jgi:hypothetical protein
MCLDWVGFPPILFPAHCPHVIWFWSMFFLTTSACLRTTNETKPGYRSVLVVGVHGADLVGRSHTQKFFAHSKMGLACVERPGYPLPAERPGDNLYVVHLSPEFLAASGGDISSTAVQKLMRGEVRTYVVRSCGGVVRQLLTRAVLQYLAVGTPRGRT